MISSRAQAVIHLLSRAELNPTSGCLEWTGGLATNGYPQAEVAGKTVRVHRYIALSVLLESDYDREQVESLGLEACHRCDNPVCIHPKHLFWGTHAMNMQDCVSKGRHSKHLPTRRSRKVPELLAMGFSQKERSIMQQRWPVNVAWPDGW